MDRPIKIGDYVRISGRDYRVFSLNAVGLVDAKDPTRISSLIYYNGRWISPEHRNVSNIKFVPEEEYKETSPIEELPTEVLHEIGLRLNLPDLANLCIASRALGFKLCRDDRFWKGRYIQDFGKPSEVKGTWIEMYKNKTSGFVYGAGDNRYGQLGELDYIVESLTLLPGPIQAKAIAAGGSHALILGTDGSVYAMGGNNLGQLGLGFTSREVRKPTRIPLMTETKGIYAGRAHSLILDTEGTVRAFGDNRTGQLGLGNILDFVESPRSVLIRFKVKAVSTGNFHTLILDLEGNVWSCGNNSRGQLGLNDYDNRVIFTRIPSLSRIKDVSAGGYHSVVLTEEGEVYVFGSNEYGQIGLGPTYRSEDPRSIIIFSKVTAISAGENHTMLLTKDSVLAFGNNEYGQLGIGEGIKRQDIPVEIGIRGKAISSGRIHSVVIDPSGTVYTFGNNSRGQLGVGDFETRYYPTQISNSFRGKAASAGGEYTLFIGKVFS